MTEGWVSLWSNSLGIMQSKSASSNVWLPQEVTLDQDTHIRWDVDDNNKSNINAKSNVSPNVFENHHK